MKRIYVPFGEDEVESGMNAVTRKQMIQRHQLSLNQYGYSPETLFWESRGVQKIRFKTLAEIGVKTGDSLLDVGCGFADLYSWLNGHDLVVDYTGIDLSPDILAKGKELTPELELMHGELFDFDWQPHSFDWLFLSGTLNWDLNDDGEYARRVIKRMFRLCRKGVAFNMLDNRNFADMNLGGLFAYDPQDILVFCKQITPDCQCRDDYHDNDFTIYMRR